MDTHRRAAWPLSILLPSLAWVSCVPGEVGMVALDELESLAFVPPGESVLLARTGPALVCENVEALLVGRYEVTRRELREWVEAASVEVDPALVSEARSWTEETHDWPASFVALPEARAYAASRGMRLPTAIEWLRIASGTRAQPWPWGPTEIQSVANTLALRLDRPGPVGTFEQGRTPSGVYDLLGNVWEWVEAPAGGGGSAELGARCMGGSFASRQRRLFEIGIDGRLVLHEQELDPGTRSTDVGVRVVAVAREWFRARAAEIGNGAESRARLRGIGRRWGTEAAPALERLAREPGAPGCLLFLLEGARP